MARCEQLFAPKTANPAGPPAGAATPEFLSDPLRRLLTMVAIASLPTTVTTPGRAHRAAPAHRPGPGARRPPLALVPAQRPAARTIAGRSLAAVVGAALLGLAVVLAIGYLAATPTAAPGTSVAGTHVVAEGETMWSIAVEHAPAGGAAGYVERLVAANDGAVVTPGQELLLPAS